jgi:RNA polymerase sigma-70 factor (ECF subfamily)
MNGSDEDRRLTGGVTALLPPCAAVGTYGDSAETTATATFDAIYAEHFPFVWRCLRGLGVGPAAVDDAAQDVFVVVHRRLGDFEGHSTMRTWLFGIVRNVASNHRRSMARKGKTEEPSDDTAATEPGPHAILEDREAAAFIRDFLLTLDERKRDLFVLCMLEETSVPEAAETLAIPLNTAYTRLRRVRADFRQALTQRRDRHATSR